TVGAEAHEWRFAAEDGSRVAVTLLAADLARVQFLPSGILPARSWAVARDEWPAVEARAVVGENGLLTLATDAMRLELATDPFRLTCRWPDGFAFAEDDPALGMGCIVPDSRSDIPDVSFPAGAVRCHQRLAPGERVLGAGERT